MKIDRKVVCHLLGGLFGLAGVAFVVLKLKSYIHQIDMGRFHLSSLLLISFFSIVYGAANLFLVRAWFNILRFFDQIPVWKGSVKIYGLSQLAKYVPGNIFHLAGRQALGMAEGLPSKVLAKSILWELILQAFGGGFYVLLLLPLVFPALPERGAAMLFVCAVLAISLGIRSRFSALIGTAVLWQILFLAVSSILFIGTLATVVPPGSELPSFTTLCGAYVIAWLIGFVTPGAPAGVGIREIVLLFLLGKQIAEVDLLLAIVAGRIVTVSGDFLFFMTTVFFQKNRGENEGKC